MQSIDYRRYILCALALCVALVYRVDAQLTKRSTPFSLFASGGSVLAPIPMVIANQTETRSSAFRSGFFGGLGAAVGPYRMSNDLDWSLELSAEVHAPARTELSINRQSISEKHIFAPVVVWYKIQPHSEITPFVHAGGGVTYAQWSFRYAELPEESHGDWAFVWGVGGGLSIRMALRMSMEICFDVLSIEGTTVYEFRSGYLLAVQDRVFLFPIGVKLRFHL